MARPAVFFDRDNTLIVSDGYLGDPSQVVLVEGAADAVARVRALGFAAVVISNQSGVARGMFDEEAVRAVNLRMDELLKADNANAVIDRHEFCPYHPEATVEAYRQDSPLRKPKPGMLLAAAEGLKLDLARSWLIGDAPRDVEAARAAGVARTILFSDPALPASPAAADQNGNAVTPEHTVSSLKEAAAIIERSLVAKAATAASAAAAAAKPPAPKPVKAEGRPAAVPAAPPPAATSRLEAIAEQILHELRRRNEQYATDFSVSKLLAGIVQVLVLATLFLGYLSKSSGLSVLHTYIFVALTLQTMTIALLIMSRQK
jgi:D-glycero-D-manno-heptose 1,7-bisphosphate phosphatase